MHLLFLILLFLESHFCVQSSDSNSPVGDNMATNGLPFPWSKMRLPNYIVPVHYHLLIHPNLTTLRFNGSVKIELDVKNNTNWVVLHSKNLKIFTATVLDEHETHLSDKVLSVLEYPPHEQIAIFSPKILTSGEKYFLYLEFGAPLSDGFYGFYKSTYRTKAGETRYSSHFWTVTLHKSYVHILQIIAKQSNRIFSPKGSWHPHTLSPHLPGWHCHVLMNPLSKLITLSE